MPSSALVLIAPGFEEVEATTPIDLLRRAGAFVTLASCSDSITVTGRSNITLTADCLLANIQDPNKTKSLTSSVSLQKQERL